MCGWVGRLAVTRKRGGLILAVYKVYFSKGKAPIGHANKAGESASGACKDVRLLIAHSETDS